MKKLILFTLLLLPLIAFGKERNSVFLNISPADTFLQTHKNKIDFQLDCAVKSKKSEKWYRGYPGSQVGNSLSFEAYNVLLCPSEETTGNLHAIKGIYLKLFPQSGSPIVKFLEFPEKMKNQAVKTRQICDIQFNSNNEIKFKCHLLKLR